VQNDTVVAVDIAKDVFEVAVSDRRVMCCAGRDWRDSSSLSSSPNCPRRRW
jgi:hypothetical protein